MGDWVNILSGAPKETVAMNPSQSRFILTLHLSFITLQLDAQLLKACTVIDACIHGNPESTRKHLPTILKSLIPLLSSHLAAPRVSHVLTDLRKAAFETDADTVGKLL